MYLTKYIYCVILKEIEAEVFLYHIIKYIYKTY